MTPTVREVVDVALLHQAVEVHAERHPNHVAVDEGDSFITYGSLTEEFCRLASVLQMSGSRRNDRVGFLIDNSIEACIAILGILRSDCCYVPLGPELPADRLAKIIYDAEMHAIITVGINHRKLGKVLDAVVGRCPKVLITLGVGIDTLSEEYDEGIVNLGLRFDQIYGPDIVATASPNPLENKNIEEDLAYIIYTSGTTGLPKGVMITHKNVKSFIMWVVDYLGLSLRDRISNHPRVNFDLSVLDLYGSFFSGATLCPIKNRGDRAFPGKFIKDRKITIWCSVPSVIGMMRKAKQLTPGVFSDHLRMFIFCGEILPVEYALTIQLLPNF